jgi:general secretion pathway protein G
MRRQPLAAAGFSLIELLVVLAILGLLIGLVAPPVIKYLGRAKTDVARGDIRNLESALDLFRLDLGRCPTQQEGLQALVEKPVGLDRCQGPYLKQKNVLDPGATRTTTAFRASTESSISTVLVPTMRRAAPAKTRIS